MDYKMKILKSTPETLQDFLEKMVDLAKQVFPTLDRTIVGDTVVNIHQDKDHSTATSLWWDNIKYDEVQSVHYIANIMYAAGYRDEFLAMIQQIIDETGLVADDNFTPTPIGEDI